LLFCFRAVIYHEHHEHLCERQWELRVIVRSGANKSFTRLFLLAALNKLKDCERNENFEEKFASFPSKQRAFAAAVADFFEMQFRFSCVMLLLLGNYWEQLEMTVIQLRFIRNELRLLRRKNEAKRMAIECVCVCGSQELKGFSCRKRKLEDDIGFCSLPRLTGAAWLEALWTAIKPFNHLISESERKREKLEGC